MKKYMSILMLLAILLSCCACGAEENTDTSTAATAATEAVENSEEPVVKIPTYEEMLAQIEAEQEAGKMDPEQQYGSINQLEPIDGVYKVWSAVGVKNMADHPDATFELLCNIDMKGETVRPIGSAEKPFTGTILGVNCTISNFTVEGSVDGYLGFIAVNDGLVRNLILDNVTFVTDENTKVMGGIAAKSTTEILRCTVNGTMVVDKAAEDAICGTICGETYGKITNSVSDVDVVYNAAGSATIGGVLGTADGVHIEFSEGYGYIEVAGDNKTVGVMIGDAKNTTMNTVAYLGEKNTVNGQFFEEYFGKSENVTYETLLRRENGREALPENVQALRDRVVEEMYAMGMVEWHTTQNLYHDCTCLLTVCHGNYVPGKLHVGIPYNHKGGSLARFNYIIDENGAVKDDFYDMESFDGFDSYIGNDCSTSVLHAYWTVSNTADFIRCGYMKPNQDGTANGYGVIMVGEYNVTQGIDENGKAYTSSYTDPYVRANGHQVMYEAYAQMRKGDSYYSSTKDGGHTRMAAEDPVVVRDENGLINGNYSYVLSHEQGAPAVTDPYFHTWRLNYKYTFQQLYMTNKFPVTIEELLTGEMEPVECEMIGGLDGKFGMVTGTVKSNYFLDSVTLTITDSQGNEVFNHIMWATVNRFADQNSNDNGIRNYNDQYDMAGFANALQTVQLEPGETYSYTVTAGLATKDHIVVKEGSFVNGSAQ